TTIEPAMTIESGAILTALVLAVLLASAVALLVSWAYRRRMVALMRAAPPPDDSHAAAPPPRQLPGTSAGTTDLGVNRRAYRRLLLALAGLCLVIGLTQAWLALHFVYQTPDFSFNRLLILGLVYAWPMVLAWGLAARWPWTRVVAGILVYLGLMAAVVMIGSTAAQSLAGVLSWLGGVVAIPLLVTLFISASGRIRAVAPYLLPPFLILSASSVAVLEVLVVATGGSTPPSWLAALLGVLGAYGTIAVLVLAPWLVLAWPVYALARWLAAAYRDKRFSDLSYLLGAYWFVVLSASALPALQGVGWAGLTQLLPWLWIPLAWRVLPGWLRPAADPPTLLVLRVFQRDAAVEALFDRVVERWRLTGNTVLIAGTDLISRTLDPDDLFAFFNRALASRFIPRTAEIPARLAAFDLRPDPDGRYRVNECYCFDTTWQATLEALVERSDQVLMDLRGFRAENQGCRFELRALAAAAHLQRVVLLYDDATARAIANDEIAAAPASRFVWLDGNRLNRATTQRVIHTLFAATDDRAAQPAPA
ncbi:MAG: hypothetical protein RLZ44_1552, partial [Pseudomonadota bacterium]